MTYTLTEEEYNELKNSTIATKSVQEDTDLFEFIRNSQYVQVVNDTQQYGEQVLKVAILLYKVPDKYLQFITQRSTKWTSAIKV